MKVRVLDEVVPEPGVPSPAIDFVIALASQRLIRLVSQRPERDGLSLRLRRWMGEERAREVRGLFANPPRSYPFSREVDLVTGGSDFDRKPIRLGPDDVGWLRLPVRVYLENSRNDWGFVEKSVPSTWRAAFNQSRELGLLQEEASGGLPEMVEIANAKHEHDPKLRRRSCFLFDSDGPPGAPSVKAVELEGILKRLDVPHHRLWRRAIENYVPRKQRRSWVHCDLPLVTDREAWMNAFDTLKDGDRWSFPMKNGDPTVPPPLDKGLPMGRNKSQATPLSAVWGDPGWLVPERDLNGDGSTRERVEFVQMILSMVA